MNCCLNQKIFFFFIGIRTVFSCQVTYFLLKIILIYIEKIVEMYNVYLKVFSYYILLYYLYLFIYFISIYIFVTTLTNFLTRLPLPYFLFKSSFIYFYLYLCIYFYPAHPDHEPYPAYPVGFIFAVIKNIKMLL